MHLKGFLNRKHNVSLLDHHTGKLVPVDGSFRSSKDALDFCKGSMKWVVLDCNKGSAVTGKSANDICLQERPKHSTSLDKGYVPKVTPGMLLAALSSLALRGLAEQADKGMRRGPIEEY